MPAMAAMSPGPDDDSAAATRSGPAPVRGAVHHVELWVPDLDRAVDEWGWLLSTLGYRVFQQWDGGTSWRLGGDAGVYLVVEQSPAMLPGTHDRLRPGLNHLALHAGSREQLDQLMAAGGGYGWKPLFAEKYPHAGGEQTYAGYLENSDGFEVELVAAP